jgi:Domain of unknown function (DUF4082)/IPT/TIG domain
MEKRVVVRGYPSNGYPNNQYPGDGYPSDGYPPRKMYFDYRGRGFIFTSIVPAIPSAGQVVTLFGENLSFNSLPEWIGGNTPRFTLINETAMSFIAPFAGTYSVGGLPITIASAGVPLYVSISPGMATAGSLVTITGTNFSPATPPVWTGGNQPVFTYVSTSTITFVAPSAGSYTVGGLAISTTAAPVIANIISISPNIPIAGETVTVTGTGFTAGTLIYENNVSVTKIFINSTTITYVASASGVVNISINPITPTFTSLSSSDVLTRSTVTLTGTNFYTGFTPNWTGGNTPVFTVLNATSISFAAPIVGSYTVAGFPLTVTAIPSYISLSASSAATGTLITLTGLDITSATPPVWTGGNQPVFNFVNSTTITFVAPAVGSYTVGGLAFSSTLLSTFTSVSPANAPDGVIVTLKGTNFTAGTVPSWTGGTAPIFRYVDPTTITFTSPSAGSYTVAGLALTTFTAFKIYQGTPNPIPSGIIASDPNVYEVGAKFTPTVNGTLVGITFFNADSIGTRTVRLWNAAPGATTPVATAVVTSPAQGWVFVPINAALVAGTSYITAIAQTQGRIDVSLPNANVSPDPRIGFSSASSSVYVLGSGLKPSTVNSVVLQGALPVITFP